MKVIQITVTLAVFLLSGCANRYQPMTQSEVDMQNFRFTAGQVEAIFKECYGAIEAEPSGIYVGKNILYLSESSPNKLELMSSSSKITDSQKKELLAFLKNATICRNKVIQQVAPYPSIQNIHIAFGGDMDIVYADLLSRKITIGEANKEKSRLTSKARADITAATNSISSQYVYQYNQDMNRQAAEDNNRRAIAAGYLMNMQNQMNNNRPVQTNCTKFGNQVNCTSQ